MKQFDTLFNDEAKLNYALSCCEDIIRSNYFNHIKELPLRPPILATTCLQLIEIYPPYNLINEPLFDCMLASLHHLRCSVAFFLSRTNQEVSFYIALQDSKTLSMSTALVVETLCHLLDEDCFHVFSSACSERLFKNHLFNPNNIAMLSNCTLKCKVGEPTSSEPLEIASTDFLDFLGENDTTFMFLATPVSSFEVQSFVNQIGDHVTTLAAYESLSYTFTNTKNTNDKKDCIDDNHDICIDNTTLNNTCNNSCTNNNSITVSTSPKFKNENAPSLNISGGDSLAHTTTDNNSKNHVETQENKHLQRSVHSDTLSSSTSNSFSYKVINSVVLTMQKQADELTNDLYTLPPKPLFYYSFYCFSPLVQTSLLNTFNYVNLANRSRVIVNDYFVTSWLAGEPLFCPLLEELRNLRHPVFSTRSSQDGPLASFISIESLKTLLPLTSS